MHRWAQQCRVICAGGWALPPNTWSRGLHHFCLLRAYARSSRRSGQERRVDSDLVDSCVRVGALPPHLPPHS